MKRAVAAVAWPAARRMLRPRLHRFERALAQPVSAQAETLRRILRGSAGSEYGREHGINGDESYEAFCAKVPVVEYEDLRPWIERQARDGGEHGGYSSRSCHRGPPAVGRD